MQNNNIGNISFTGLQYAILSSKSAKFHKPF